MKIEKENPKKRDKKKRQIEITMEKKLVVDMVFAKQAFPLYELEQDVVEAAREGARGGTSERACTETKRGT